MKPIRFLTRQKQRCYAVFKKRQKPEDLFVMPGRQLHAVGKARAITHEFCRHHGIPYSETSFSRALVEAAKYFRAVPPARLAAEALS